MKRRKKRKLKRWVKPSLGLLIIVIIILLLIPFYNKKKNDNNNLKNNINMDKVISNIEDKINDPKIDADFLKWVSDNYKEKSLESLSKYLEKNDYDKSIWHKITNNSLVVLQDLYNDNYTKLDNVKQINGIKDEITLSFVGDVSLADNWYIMPKYDERGKKVYGILSDSVVKIMNDSDIMVANNEFTVSDRGEKMPGKYYTFRASPKRLSIYEEMGVDLVTLANNHVYDFGKTAFYDMLDALKEYNIPYIGAGKNIEEAKKPYYYIINGYKIAFINATRAEKLILTPEATENEGGVFRCYDPEAFAEAIKQAKEESDYVVALIHWGKEDSHDLEEVQKETSRTYIDSGADIIVGTHAHTLQGIEYYNNKPIIYNLGDFIFNNETKDTGIFQIKMTKDGDLSYYFIPCLEKDEYTKVLKGEEKQRVITNMNTWSINASINESGEIKEVS